MTKKHFQFMAKEIQNWPAEKKNDLIKFCSVVGKQFNSKFDEKKFERVAMTDKGVLINSK